MEDEDKTSAARNVIIPSYACDEIKKDGFVRVIVAIKGLTTKRTMKNFKMVRKAENAVVAVDFDDRTIDLTVEGKEKDLKRKYFELKIKKLPYDIDKDKSYHEVDNDRILLFLKKKKIDQSWYPELGEVGLETEEDE